MEYKIMYADYGIWYLYGEGKIAREMVAILCQSAGVQMCDLAQQPDVWHVIKVEG